MKYAISSHRPSFILRHARVAGDAQIIGEDLAGEGREDVMITTPEGERFPLRQFAIHLRETRSAA